MSTPEQITQHTEKNQSTDNEKTRFAVSSPVTNNNFNQDSLSSGVVIKSRYRLEEKIGSGGMSDIYRATDLFLQQAGVTESSVAIKVLQQQFIHQPEALQLLLQEAHKTQQLSHPNIVRVFDVDQDQQHYFIVMEFLDAESLEQVIKRHKPKGLALSSTIKLLQHVAQALHFAHQTGIVHADLKPANIMVNRLGVVKVLDFGVSQQLQLNPDMYASEQVNLSAPLNGYTPAYASAQLLAGHTPDTSDDIYSFACLAYELLTSKHPFDRLPADQAKAQNKQAQKPRQLNIVQWQALKTALQFDTRQRNISLSKLMSRLQTGLLVPTAIAAAIGVLCFGVYQYHHQNQQLINDYISKIEQTEATHQLYLQLSHTAPEQLLASLHNSEITPLIKDALLRSKRTDLLQFFETQIDNLLSDRSFVYPDYPQIEQVLQQALNLYPDSHNLAQLNASALRSKQTAIEVLRNQLRQLLLEQQYQKQSNGMDPFKIAAELHRVEPGYLLLPEDAEAKVYLDAYQLAAATNDAEALQQLIEVGNLLFSKHDSTAESVAQGAKLADAVNTMASYRKSVANNQNIEFPYQAAELFYRHSFELLQQELTASEKAGEVDAVYDKLQQYNAMVPADFSLHVNLRRQLADKYLGLSTQLLQSNQVRTAERLMRRANALMSSLNS